MGVLGMRLKYELEAISIRPRAIAPKKSIATTRSFLNKLWSLIYYENVATFAANVPRNYASKKSCCHTIIVMLVVDKHIQTSKYYFNCAVTLPYGSNSTLTIANAAIALLKKNFMQVMSI
jgi:DNA polymerase V